MPKTKHTAAKARKAEIAIQKQLPRAVFLAGVAGAALIGFAAGLFAL